MWLWFACGFGCRPPDDPPAPPPADAREAFEQAGFEVGDGALVFSTMEGCCDPGAYCWGNNPSTPYGTYALPAAPGEPAHVDTLLKDFGPVPPGLSRDFLLRPDEAVVWVGEMPPAARYFGLRSYIGERPGADAVPIGSLGAVLNQQVVEAQLGAAPWGEPVAVVTSANPEAERRAIDALAAAGWPAERVFTDRIAPVVEMGLDPAVHDTFFALVRVAIYDDPAAGAAWEADPGALYRLTPRAPLPAAAHPMPVLPSRGSGVGEGAWADAVADLDAAVLARHDQPGAVPAVIIPYWRETLACIEGPQSCTGDSRDRYVGVSPEFVLPTEDSYIVAWGVNHERTGKASYSSVSVQTIVAQRGIASFESVAMVGSARAAREGAPGPLDDDLYVVVFARDCAGRDEVCIEVPWQCPGGGPSERFKLTGRAYLEPSTGAAPVPEELIVDRLLLVVPEAE